MITERALNEIKRATEPADLEKLAGSRGVTREMLLADLARIGAIARGEPWYDYQRQEWVEEPPSSEPGSVRQAAEAAVRAFARDTRATTAVRPRPCTWRLWRRSGRRWKRVRW